MKTIYPSIVYEGEILSVKIISIYDGIPYILKTRKVYDGDITQIQNDEIIKKTIKKIDNTFYYFEDELNLKFSKIYVVIDSIDYYFNKREFGVEFSENREVEKKDLDLILRKAFRKSEEENDYSVVSFITDQIILDDKEIASIVGHAGKKITLKGELVYIDEQTFNVIDNIVNQIKKTFSSYIVSSYSLKKVDSFKNNNAIVEFTTDKIKFLINSRETVQNFTMDLGFGHLFQKLYLNLVKENTATDSEKIVRYLQNNFILNNLKYDIQVTDKLSFNQIIAEFKIIAIEYMKGIFNQIYKKNIKLEKIYIMTENYSDQEWKIFLEENLDFKVEIFNIPRYNTIHKDDLKLLHSIAYFDQIKIR